MALVDELEQQIETLTLANQSPNHIKHLEQTIVSQQTEIQRLSQTIDNKSKELFKSFQQNNQLQKQFQSCLAKEQQINLKLQNKLLLRLSKNQEIQRQLRLSLSEANQLNLQLQAKIRQLEQALEADELLPIKLNSHNSNLPPSLDLPWQKIKHTRSLRTKSGLQVGGQFGHPGFTLKQVREPDLIIVHQVDVCQHCYYSLISSEPIRFNKRQIFEIENGRLTIIEHQTEVKLCPLCEKISKGHFPDNIKAPVQYGASVFSRIVYLNQYQLLPVARTAETMDDLFQCPISLATIGRATQVCSQKLIRFEYRLKAKLRQSEVMGVDETGIRVNGENNWVHVARTESFTHLAFHSKRGRAAIEEIGIINEFTGTLVRDGLISYQKYKQCQHSLCNAHLLRDLTFIGESDPTHQSWTSNLASLLFEIKKSVELAKSNSLFGLDDSILKTFSNRYDRILDEAELVIRGSPERRFLHLSARTLQRRFIRNKEEILRFMTDFSVPFDNNGSERDLRMLKLQQKISGCFRSTEGVKVFCRIRSYLSSIRKQGGGLHHAIESALQGKPIVLLAY